MANVIDELVVSLSLDAKAFAAGTQQTRADLKKTSDAATSTAKSMETQGANTRLTFKKTSDAATITAKEMEARGTQAAAFFSKVKVEALGLIGVLLGGKGLEAFVKDATVSLAALGRSAENIGESVPALAAFRNMIARNGGSAESATASLKGYADQIERFHVLGDATVLQFLNPIGASDTDSPLVVFGKFMKFVEENKNKPGGAQLINLEGQGLGFDQGLINAAIQMGSLARAQRELAQSYELGVPTEEQTKRAQQLQHDFIALTQAAENLGNVLLTDAEPGLHSFLVWLTETTEKSPGVTVGMAAIAGWLTVIAGLNFRAVLAFLGGPELAAFMAIIGLSMGMPDPGGFDQGPGPGFANSPLMKWWRGDAAEPPAGAGGGPGSSIAPPAPGTPAHAVMQQTRAFWLSKGFTEAQVAGILAGGPAAESGFNPALSGDGGSSYGLYQEHAARKAALFARFGPNPTADQQNQFAWDELNDPQQRNLLGAMRAAKTPEEAAAIWTRGFEVPANTGARAAERAAAAGQFLPSRRAPDPALSAGPRVSRSNSTSSNSLTTGDIHIHGVRDGQDAANRVQQAITDSWMVQANRGLQ